MRVTPALLSLCTLAAAQSQAPLLDQVKGWFAKATAAASSIAASASPSVPNPASVGAAAVASTQVDQVTLENHKNVFTPGAATSSPGIETWMLYVTGGNKTCFGRCDKADEQWNRSVPALSVSKNAPHLFTLDCETQPVLCNAWATGPPAIYYIQVPQPAADQSQPSSTARYIQLNRTSVTSDEITKLHTAEEYKKTEPYEGLWHPIDSPLAKTGANIYLGYAVWGFSLIPSWAFMIGVSMISRTIMSRRLSPEPPRAPQGGAQRPAAAASS